MSLPTTDSVTVLVGPAERPLLRWDPTEETAAAELQPAVEPLPPAEIASVEELYLVGRHLEQYRHATRSPEPYWTEALTRDPGHVASHVALGTRRYREARFAEAEQHARSAVERLTRLNPNPEVGDAHYLLGLTLTRLGRDDEAYEAFAKASWLDAFVGPGEPPAGPDRRAPRPRRAGPAAGRDRSSGLPRAAPAARPRGRAAPPTGPRRRGSAAAGRDPGPRPAGPLGPAARRHPRRPARPDRGADPARRGAGERACWEPGNGRRAGGPGPAGGCPPAAGPDRLRGARRLPRRRLAGSPRRPRRRGRRPRPGPRRRPELELRLPARRRRRPAGGATGGSGRPDRGCAARSLVLRARSAHRGTHPVAALGRARAR